MDWYKKYIKNQFYFGIKGMIASNDFKVSLRHYF